MKYHEYIHIRILVFLVVITAAAAQAAGPSPSWKEGLAKLSIISFVQSFQNK